MSSSHSTDDEAIYRETTDRFWIFRLVAEVRANGIDVRLAPFQRSFRRIQSGQIQNVRTTAYAATTYSGWHWGLRRTPGGHTVYRLRGGEGVEVVPTSGERWFIGSQRATELEAAIEQLQPSNE